MSLAENEMACLWYEADASKAKKRKTPAASTKDMEKKKKAVMAGLAGAGNPTDKASDKR